MIFVGVFFDNKVEIFGQISWYLENRPWKHVIQHQNSGNISKSKIARSFAVLLPIALGLQRIRATITIKISLLRIKLQNNLTT